MKDAKELSACTTTTNEPSVAGNALKVFNDRNRVLHGEQFYIEIK